MNINRLIGNCAVKLNPNDKAGNNKQEYMSHNMKQEACYSYYKSIHQTTTYSFTKIPISKNNLIII